MKIACRIYWNMFVMQSDAQVFITDTHKERLQQAFMKIGKDYDLIEL